MNASYLRYAALALAASTFVAGCGGGSSSNLSGAIPTARPTASPTPGPTLAPTATPTASPTPTATASATPAALTVAPTALAFDATGSANAQTFVATDANYSGPLTETDTCANVATVTPTTATGPGATFTVSPVGAGSCAITITDNRNYSAVESIGVTLTTGGFN
jgi:hypothetical protein